MSANKFTNWRGDPAQCSRCTELAAMQCGRCYVLLCEKHSEAHYKTSSGACRNALD